MLKEKKIQIVNLMSKINSQQEFQDPNTIKVLTDKNSNAIYFSRSTIPFGKFTKKNKSKKQVCIIPFRRDFLKKYNELKPTNLEKVESIDMLRVIENGHDVKMIDTKYYSHAVDTKKDALKVSKLLKK